MAKVKIIRANATVRTFKWLKKKTFYLMTEHLSVLL